MAILSALLSLYRLHSGLYYLGVMYSWHIRFASLRSCPLMLHTVLLINTCVSDMLAIDWLTFQFSIFIIAYLRISLHHARMIRKPVSQSLCVSKPVSESPCVGELLYQRALVWESSCIRELLLSQFHPFQEFSFHSYCKRDYLCD